MLLITIQTPKQCSLKQSLNAECLFFNEKHSVSVLSLAIDERQPNCDDSSWSTERINTATTFRSMISVDEHHQGQDMEQLPAYIDGSVASQLAKWSNRIFKKTERR